MVRRVTSTARAPGASRCRRPNEQKPTIGGDTSMATLSLRRTFQAGISAAALTLAFSGSAAAADSSPLIAAIKNQDHDAARALLKQPARASQVETDGTTPLHYAAEAGDLQLVQMLLKAGAKPV